MAASERQSHQSLAGKVAIVTGSSRGIGAAIALELARRGAKVAITYTSPSSEKAVDELESKINTFGNGSSVIKVREDLRNLDAPAKIVAATVEHFGHSIDVLVNNAGMEKVKELKDITPDDFSEVFELNVRAALFMTQAVLPHLRKPGRVINISSVGARCGFEKLSLYCASKAAMEGMTRSHAAELGAVGHTVNVVEPGPTESDMIHKIPQDLVQRQKDTTPVEKRLGNAEDIADVVAWLAEEQSRWISGQTISASGGWTML
ncbi:dehydrogenase with different specificitie [Rhizodiscina lignyota]|uniref:Dehydrogenase with different specificitie n=1 Tax=Rhizodiscina lignyota TaxID=1504668 RepID=A0A9P4IIL5_9PEZI|nr:dehydrogenase with different specificitie [Rhizodiscina lignyota]